jgi:lysophospholipid acyltransferase (LPLAT)-like uncharacterized protein
MPATPDTPGSAPGAPDETVYKGRRLTRLRRVLYWLGTPVAMLLVRFWWLTCRVVRVVGAEHVGEGLEGGPLIPVYWHQHQLFCTRFLLHQRARGMQPGFLISPSVDGEIPAMIARREKTYVIRGSSSHTGARTLRDYYVALQKGVSPAITVDGPYGPAFECKPGAVLLAQLSGRPIVALSFHADRAWLFRTWDRFVLPWPFARITIVVGAPRTVPKRVDAAEVLRLQQAVTDELRQLYRSARELAGG